MLVSSRPSTAWPRDGSARDVLKAVVMGASRHSTNSEDSMASKDVRFTGSASRCWRASAHLSRRSVVSRPMGAAGLAGTGSARMEARRPVSASSLTGRPPPSPRTCTT